MTGDSGRKKTEKKGKAAPKPARTKVHVADLLRGLMDVLPDHIYFKDLDSRFIRINKAHARHLGLKDPKEAVGKTDFDMFAREHAEKALCDEKKIIESGMSIEAQEENLLWPNGTETWVSTSKAPLHDSEGNIIGTFGVTRDITAIKRQEIARKALEGRMQQADKMESLGMLASGIAHDFNNLLMGVLGNASLAMAQLPDESPVMPIVEDIKAASVRASDLTNQLLAYAGRGSVTISKVDIAILVREMAKLLEVTISKNVALRYAFAEDLPKVEGDVTQLRQLIMNLITNASDAIGERSGTITISTSTIECDEAYLEQVRMEEELKPGNYVALEVSDTGAGISDEAMQKILDPFFTTKPMGRGLGLATVHGIVRGHKGALKIYSEVGKGTTFKVLLRSAERSTVVKTRGKKKDDIKHWRGKGTVLIVDDEDIIRKVSSQMLDALGFESLSASSGWEALEIFQERKKDITLVLLDEVMPRMDGEEVFTELRRIKPDVRVVLCSGYTRFDATSRFTGKGLAGFIQKPFTLQILAEELKAICEK